MPVRLRVLEKGALLHVVFEGTVTDADLQQLSDELLGASESVPGQRELIDLRGVEAQQVSSDALREMSERFTAADRAPGSVKSAVVASTDFIYGLARMYQTFRSESALQLQVFREMEEALEFLGLDAEPGLDAP